MSQILKPTQLQNLDPSDTISLYIPRVHRKYSTRDIRIRFQHALGHQVSVDLAYNHNTGFNMAYIFIKCEIIPKEQVENFIEKKETIKYQCSNGEWVIIHSSLRILLRELKIQNCLRFWPEGMNSAFWLILPSKCDHIAEENNEIQILTEMENTYSPIFISTDD
jgi:hypothetical protein